MIRPRRLGHRGTVLATGFVIDATLIGLAEAQRRILSLWMPGAVVRNYRGHLVVTGLRPARVRASLAPGVPLVHQCGVLAAMPLDADEAAALAVPGAFVFARGGVAEVVPVHETRAIDLGTWIDLGEFEVAKDVRSLAAQPARAEIPPPPACDMRTITGVPAADDAAAEVSAALTRARASAGAGHGGPSLWGRLVRWLADRIAPRRAALREPNSTTAPLNPSRFDKLRGRIAEALWKSRLGAALGRRHAAYLRRVLELFDRGELEEALRHAIPIGGDGGDARLGVGVPRPRQDLRLSFTSRRNSSIMPVADVAMAMMRDRYRAAAARLEQSGRVDEAAFVLAELLGDPMAAIALLERHGRHALAARLAEGRGLEPGLVVRLWFLAGDRERAIDTARRHHAWADAVARLERSGDARAAVLRMLWADHLADAGDFVQAVQAAWPVETSRALVEGWIDRGIAGAGSAAARLLVKKLIVAPSSFPTIAPAILTVLDDPDADASRRRLALVEELVAAPTSAELRTIARPAVRALLRDCGQGAAGTNSELLERLIRFADDAALRADQPTLSAAPRAATLLDRGTPLEFSWSAEDAGVLPVYDAATLPGGRVLVALGELGVRMIGRDGRTVAHIDQPASRLVVSDHGTRALAIASRGQVQRIARLDLIERRGAHWCDAELDVAATTFDGDLWIATRGREVFAVDTTASRWRAVWGIELEPPQARCSIRRDGKWFAIEVVSDGALEHWYYEGFTLRARTPWDRNGTEFVAARPTIQQTFVVRDPADAVVSDVAQIVAVEVAGELAVTSRRKPSGLELDVVHLKAHREIARLRLDGATTTSIRLVATELTIGDDRGRLIVVDLQSGSLRRDLRTL